MQSVFRQARTIATGRLPLLAAVTSGLALAVVLAVTTGMIGAVVTGVAVAAAMAGLLIMAGNQRPAPAPVRVRRR